jgi:hypothetical protein
LRPGEKLHEELIYAHEARLETAHPRIFQIQSQETSLVLRNRLLRIVQGFASGRVERHAFTTELVAVAAELVVAPLSGGATASNTDKSLVGRRHLPASEGSAGQVNVPHQEAARNSHGVSEWSEMNTARVARTSLVDDVVELEQRVGRAKHLRVPRHVHSSQPVEDV